jgi:hypothetical protein
MPFDGLLFSAEMDQGLTPSFVSGHAALQIFFDGQVQLRGQFRVQFVIELLAAENGGDPVEKLLQPVNH